MESNGRIAIILAGGEGEQLGLGKRKRGGHSSARRISHIYPSSGIVERTRQRVALAFPVERIVTVAPRPLESSFENMRTDMNPARVVVQPRDRGTAPAILHALLSLQKVTPHAEVAVFPSHHYVEDGQAFMRHVDLAFEGIRIRPDLIVLLGTVPDGPTVDCCWIEMGNRVTEYLRFFEIRRFWEKPSDILATRLWQLGCLWNSSVFVAHLSAFLLVMRRVFPKLVESFDALGSTIGTEKESEIAKAVYGNISDQDFAYQVSAACPANLAVLPVCGVEWKDLRKSHRSIEASPTAQSHPISLRDASRPPSRR
jgi:mannose-1-phosphate guanylyltransferase